jgi:hypothetical protein
MDMAAILALLEKGITLLPTLVSAGIDITQTVEKLVNLTSSAQAGTVTAEQLADVETELDAQITDFNAPMA